LLRMTTKVTNPATDRKAAQAANLLAACACDESS
jgi:hypothetical protein